MIVHEIDLPFPVSVNALWRKNAHGVYKSPRAKSWVIAADRLWLSQKHGIPEKIQGPFYTEIKLSEACGWGRSDSDNLAKQPLDFAQRIGLIANDKNSRKTTTEWVEAAEAPFGCRLILREIEKFDPVKDIRESVSVGFEAIRERKAKGGPGWGESDG